MSRAQILLTTAALCTALAACNPSGAGDARATTPAAATTAVTGPQTAPAAAGAASAPRTEALPNFVALVEQVGPAVVNITTVRSLRPGSGGVPDAEDPMFEFFRRFMPPGAGPGAPGPGAGEPPLRQQGLGSGFVVSADGHVLTNAHVIAEADEVTVRLAGSKRDYKAKVIGVDRRTDIGLVKVDAKDLPVARLASTPVRPGEWVAAIGSPFGLANTITAGIVSATERALPSENFVPFIQTDVAVNPGNSGGPLINLRGEVVGINSQIYSRTGGYMGVSFAIPIEVAVNISEQLRTTGKVTRGRLGVTIQPVGEELARSFKLDAARGVLVTQVDPGSPAAKAGLQSGDIILSYNGKQLDEANELPLAVASTKPGTTMKLEVWRDGARREVPATIAELPSEDVASRSGGDEEQGTQRPSTGGRLGLALAELPAEGRRALGVDYGLVVRGVRGPAAERIRRGDVIVAVNGRRFDSVQAFEQLVRQQEAGSTVALLIRRGDAAMYVPVPVG